MNYIIAILFYFFIILFISHVQICNNYGIVFNIEMKLICKA